MIGRVVVVVVIATLLISFIMTLHSDLILKIVQEKLCQKKFNSSMCDVSKDKTTISLFFIQIPVTGDVDQWARTFAITSLIPSIFVVLIFSAVIGSIRQKEYGWMFVSIVLAAQSLIYLTISVCRKSVVEHLFAGVVLNILIGDLPGAVILAWVFVAMSTDSNMTRSIIFVTIEGMIYLGRAGAHFLSGFLGGRFPFSYFFAGTFTLAVLVFLLVYLLLPKSTEIVCWKFGKKDEEMYNNDQQAFLYYLFNPRNAFHNEYLAGVMLAMFLAGLGDNFFKSVIFHSLMDPPLQQSYFWSKMYTWGTTAFQGVACTIIAIFLTNILFASDATLILLSLSCTAFWVVLIGYTSSIILLLVLTACLAGFVPIAAGCLLSAATKGNGILSGFFVLMLGIMAAFSNACNALLVYNRSTFVNADRRIYRPFTLILAGILQLTAFIVIAAISWTFKKPLVEMPPKRAVVAIEDSSAESETGRNELKEPNEKDALLGD